MKKVYYAHFMGLYNTPQEQRDVKLLEELGFDVINPNCEEVQNHVELWKKRCGDNYESRYHEIFDDVFYERIRRCQVFAFRAMPDGRILGGVALELAEAIKHHKLIIELPSLMPSRAISKDDTIQYLKEIGQR